MTNAFDPNRTNASGWPLNPDHGTVEDAPESLCPDYFGSDNTPLPTSWAALMWMGEQARQRGCRETYARVCAIVDARNRTAGE